MNRQFKKSQANLQACYLKLFYGKRLDVCNGNGCLAFFQSCGKCRKKISVGDICVNAPLLGSEAMWHPNCFECSTCNELLINLVYCQKEGDIYCVRHHAEQIKSRCVMCDEVCALFYYLID